MRYVIAFVVFLLVALVTAFVATAVLALFGLQTSGIAGWVGMICGVIAAVYYLRR